MSDKRVSVIHNHAADRLVERYGLTFTTKLRDYIVRRIEGGHAAIVEDETSEPGTVVYDVPILKRSRQGEPERIYIRAVYTPISRSFLTFLPGGRK
jgi:hypothetical protein